MRIRRTTQSTEKLTMLCRGTRFTLSRDELLTLPEFVLLSLFPNGLLPDGHMNSYHEGDVYPVDVGNPVSSCFPSPPLATVAKILHHLSKPTLYLSDNLYHSQ